MYADTIFALILGGFALYVGLGVKDGFLKGFGVVVLLFSLGMHWHRISISIPNLTKAFNAGFELRCIGGRGSGTTIVSKSGGWKLEGDEFSNSGLSLLIRVINCDVKE